MNEGSLGSRESLKGLVFDIQRYSIHDGPGIRTLVFLKGCPLACLWCSNPESQGSEREILVTPSKCIRCGQCGEVCPSGAAQKEDVPEARGLCIACGQCVEVCPPAARRMVGKYMSVNEVMTEIEKDTPFYRRSGGGVTATGGEPLMQADFTAELLKQCRRKGIHTAVETCGYSTCNAFEKVLRYVDLVLYDIKHMDSAQHKKQTRVGNEVILENARKCAALGKEMIIRVPVIPGYNNSSESMKAIAEFARSLEGVEEVHLLPFHRLGESKYDRLGMRYSLKGVKGLDRESLAEQEMLIASYDLRVQVGG